MHHVNIRDGNVYKNGGKARKLSLFVFLFIATKKLLSVAVYNAGKIGCCTGSSKMRLLRTVIVIGKKVEEQ